MAFSGQVINKTALEDLNISIEKLISESNSGTISKSTVQEIQDRWNEIYNVPETNENSISDEIAAIKSILGMDD